MRRTVFPLFVFIAICCCLTGFQVKPSAIKDDRPNIIIILADDLGYSDLGCYGGEVQTPNLDRLAAEGLRFTQFYNTSRCCPTRASLLTGLYNHRAGIGHMSTNQGLPGYKGHLLENTVTLAEVLKSAGYNTAMVGKWHVSNTIVQPTPVAQLKWINHQTEHPLFSPLQQYPTSRGFEKFYGTLWGVVDFFDPFSLVYGTEPVKSVPKNYYHTDALNDSAASFVKQMNADGKPFFLYLAHNAPHWPVQALPEDIAKYENVYKQGWEAIRQQRYQRMIAKGLINPSIYKLSISINDLARWNANPNKEYDARAMAVHAAMIDRMDQGIGRLIKTLEETGRLNNTLIFFLSDNGASSEVCAAYGPGFDRPNETRDGRKIIYPTKKEVLPGPQTVYGAIGPEWANVCNTPFRLWKMESFEGGVRTPLIAFWPKGIKAKRGSVTAQPGHVMDFMATLVELAKTEYPVAYNSQTITPLDGASLVPVLKGGKREDQPAYFNEHEGRRYARIGDWKIVSAMPDTSWQLYHLKTDATEMTNVAKQYPGKVEQLSSAWQAWAKETKVYPKPK